MDWHTLSRHLPHLASLKESTVQGAGGGGGYTAALGSQREQDEFCTRRKQPRGTLAAAILSLYSLLVCMCVCVCVRVHMHACV